MLFLDFEPMDEGDMVEYLGEMEGLEARMQGMLKEEFARLESFEECIWRKSLRSSNTEENSGGDPPRRNADTIYNILVSVERDLEKQGNEIAQQILRITKGQEKLNYVRFCIRSLPTEQAELISHVYVKREGQTVYAAEKHYSKSMICRKTKAALESLLVLYNRRFALKKKTDKE
ncbi:MAG: hypothetical protein LUH07_15075 [Lachnospiraceae bacterium]|nr:hypothetical protein [Lachnospiraceae bacterium]